MDELPKKVRLLLLLSKQQGGLFFNYFKTGLISNFNELINIINQANSLKDINIFKFLYSYKKLAHSILYEAEESINVNNLKLKYEFAELYYLCLLIMDSQEIVNYQYDFEIINKFNQVAENLFNSNDKKFKKIIMAKMLLDIINNFSASEEYEESEDEINISKIDSIKEKIDDVIQKSINIFGKFKIDINQSNIFDYKVEEIYDEIICSLIKHQNFNDYNNLYSIIDELDLEKIDVSNVLLESLKKLININNNCMNQFIIEQDADLLNAKKINFYYILFKYILKDPLYIYQIPFLYEAKNKVVNLLKLNKLSINNLEKIYAEKLEYIILFFTGKKYIPPVGKKIKLNKLKGLFNNIEAIFRTKNCNDAYENIKKYSLYVNKLKEVLKYYKNYYFISKKDIIAQIEENIKNKNFDNISKDDYEKAVEYNDRYPIIKFIYYDSNNKKIDNEKALLEYVENWKEIERQIKDKKTKKMKRKQLVSEYFSYLDNKDILLKIFTQEQYDAFINESKKPNPQSLKEIKKNGKNEITEKEMTDAPAPINNIINAIGEHEFDKMNNNNDTKKFESLMNNKDTPNTPSETTKIISNKEKEKPMYDKVERKSPLAEHQKQYYKAIASSILEKCIIKLKLNKKNYGHVFELDEYISIGENNNYLNKNDFKSFIDIIKNEINNIFTDDEVCKENIFRLVNYFEEVKKRLLDEFINQYILKMKIELKKKNNITENEYINNVDSMYTFSIPNKDKSLSFIDNNILIYGTESPWQGFNYLIYNINQERYSEEELEINNDGRNSSESVSNGSEISVPEVNSLTFEYRVLEILRIVENNMFYNGFIKELSNGYFVYPKNENSISLLDKQYNPILEINNFKDIIVSLTEKILIDEKEKDTNNIKLVSCSKKELYLTSINITKSTSNTQVLGVSEQMCFNILEIKKNNFVLVGKNWTSYKMGLFTNSKGVENRILNDTAYFGAIKINENIIVLTSNSVFPGGEDKLKFYNIKTKKSANEIKDYSFIISPNGLNLISNIDNNKIKILLCACKKYTSRQKNGILLVNTNLSENRDIENPFYDTGTFEVHCFCELSRVKKAKTDKKNNEENEIISSLKKEKKYDDENKDILAPTNYFLVGGFNIEKREGEIKLFQAIFGEKAYNTRIVFVQDIDFKENEFFDGPINCLVQSNIKGNILASCYNGNIYLLTPPNLDFYFEDENNELM